MYEVRNLRYSNSNVQMNTQVNVPVLISLLIRFEDTLQKAFGYQRVRQNRSGIRLTFNKLCWDIIEKSKSAMRNDYLQLVFHNSMIKPTIDHVIYHMILKHKLKIIANLWRDQCKSSKFCVDQTIYCFSSKLQLFDFSSFNSLNRLSNS